MTISKTISKRLADGFVMLMDDDPIEEIPERVIEEFQGEIVVDEDGDYS